MKDWPLFLIAACVLFSLYMAWRNPKIDPNLQQVAQGQASKIFYQEHSYVIWHLTFGGSGLVHDPDCKCRQEKEKTK